MIRAYRCAALDTPLAYIRKKIDLRPPGPQAPGAVFWPPGRILARKSVFCYRTPDFVDGPFVTLEDIFDLAPSDRFLVAVRPLGGPFLALDDIFDLAPLDRFLNFSFPSYGRFREGDPQNGHILGFPNRRFSVIWTRIGFVTESGHFFGEPDDLTKFF